MTVNQFVDMFAKMVREQPSTKEATERITIFFNELQKTHTLIIQTMEVINERPSNLVQVV